SFSVICLFCRIVKVSPTSSSSILAIVRFPVWLKEIPGAVASHVEDDAFLKPGDSAQRHTHEARRHDRGDQVQFAPWLRGRQQRDADQVQEQVRRVDVDQPVHPTARQHFGPYIIGVRKNMIWAPTSNKCCVSWKYTLAKDVIVASDQANRN